MASSLADKLKAAYFNEEEKKFNDLFIQMFVYEDGRINVYLLNKALDTRHSYIEFASAFQELTGSTAIKFREVSEEQMDSPEYVSTLEKFKEQYEFGVFPNCIFWIEEMLYTKGGIVLSRKDVLGHIAKQHPPKNTKSFAPISDFEAHYVEWRWSNRRSTKLPWL